MAKKQAKRPRTPAHRKADGQCIIPGAIPVEALRQLVVDSEETEEQAIRGYMEWQAPDEKIRHLEKVTSEIHFGNAMTAWDVRTNKNRWWVITNPTNLYSQRLFPSLDYTFSFHVGVTTRMMQRDMTREHLEAHENINFLWNRLARARQTLFTARKVEEFQSVGMKCRECLLALSERLAKTTIVPEGQEAPQVGNFIAWSEIIANYVAGGSSHERLRAYLKETAKATWQLANWLTHSHNANQVDASIMCDATENVLESFMLAGARHAAKSVRFSKVKKKARQR